MKLYRYFEYLPKISFEKSYMKVFFFSLTSSLQSKNTGTISYIQNTILKRMMY